MLASLLLALALSQTPAAPVTVVFETELGQIVMAVDVARAPVTAANFLKYVDGKFYDGGVINRAVRPDNTTRKDVEIQVIQFQSDPARRAEMFPPIPLERTSVTGLKHLDGVLSMARNGPDSATSSFSIMINDQPELDFAGKRNADGQGFAAFGRVTAGMDVVERSRRRRPVPPAPLPPGRTAPRPWTLRSRFFAPTESKAPSVAPRRFVAAGGRVVIERTHHLVQPGPVGGPLRRQNAADGGRHQPE